MADTSENDSLISEFKNITGATTERARFFLESSNWALHTAISSFYESEGEAGSMDVDQIVDLSEDDLNSDSKSPQPAFGKEIPKKSSSSSSWRSSTKPKFATLHNMQQRSSDDDEEEGQAFYAGGSERSGQQVLGPPKRKDFREKLTEMFRMVHESGAVVDPSEATPSTSRSDYQGSGLRLGQTEDDHQVVTAVGRPSRLQNVKPVILKLWGQGFSINDGDLRTYEDSDNREFLATVMRGEIPNELREMGNVVSVDLEDHRHEEYKKGTTKSKIFKGSGHTLGSPAPDVEEPTPKSEPEKTESTEKKAESQVKIDSSAPTTNIQIRLADGSRISSQFNYSHTINDIRQYIISSRPQYESQNFILVTAFPTKELQDGSQTIESAGLLNASLMQRLK